MPGIGIGIGLGFRRPKGWMAEMLSLQPAALYFGANVTPGTPPAVASWLDLSGRGWSVTQSTAGDQPALVTGAAADAYLDVDNDDGSNGKRLNFPAAFCTALSGATEATVAIAWRPTDDSNGTLLSGDAFDFAIHKTGGLAPGLFVGGVGNYATAAAVTNGTDYVHIFRYYGAGSTQALRARIWTNGTEITPTRSGTIPTSIPTITDACLGRQTIDSTPVDARFYAVAIILRALETATEIPRLDLALRRGLLFY